MHSPGAGGDAGKLKPAIHPTESHVLRFRTGFSWAGAEPTEYKADDGTWSGVTRTLLAGGAELPLPFEVRYFEIAPGGRSSLENHAHEHVVFVLRGEGEVQLGSRTQSISYGDVVYVAPWEVHQFRTTGASGPLGFLCTVCKQRDRPVIVQRGTGQCEVPD